MAKLSEIMESIKMPKFLLISRWAPPLRRGAPIMLGNLLQFFPDHSYVILTSGTGFDQLDNKDKFLPVNYYFYENPPISSKSSDTSKPSHLLLSIYCSGLVRSIRDFINQNVSPFLEIARIIFKGLEVNNKERVNFFLGTSIGGPLIATLFLHYLTRKPYYIMLFDLYQGNLLTGWESVLAILFESPVLRCAKKLIVTNAATQKYYADKYGIDSEVIHNSIIVPTGRKKIPPLLLSPRRPYAISFAGAIYWAQEESLVNLISTVNKLADFRLNIYTNQADKDLQKIGICEGSKTRIKRLAPQEIQDEIRKSALVFLPLSFHTNAPDIIKTATPGKFSEYLISAVPILVHAPRDSFIAKYTRENKAGLVVDQLDKSLLARAINELINDKKLREELVKNAQKLFWKNHDARSNSRKLADILKA